MNLRMNLMSFDERIETVKKEIVAARVCENELRLRKAKNAKNVKLLNTEPNFFTASNKHGFIVMHVTSITTPFNNLVTGNI